jgi:hypothetical protein
MRAVIVTVLVLGAAFAGLLGWLIGTGFSARKTPGEMEAGLASNLRRMAVPRPYRRMPNPVPCDQTSLTEARTHWADHCATCHANSGSGESMLGRGMSPRPPDMRKPGTQEQSDGELYYVIKNGVQFTGMPAFGEVGDNDASSWKLVCFIRHLPMVTAGEEREMRGLNPKTPDDLEEERQENEFLNGGNQSGHVHEMHHDH